MLPAVTFSHIRAPRRSRSARLRLVLAGLVAAGVSASGGSTPVDASERERPGRFEPPGEGYHDGARIQALVEGWIAADPTRVRGVDLGASSGGRPVPAIAFEGGGEAPASHGPIERRTLLLVGGLDGRSQAGSEAVLRTAHSLLRRIDHLPLGVEIIAVPWASPDGLARVQRGDRPSGIDATPVDSDQDGRLDEDGGEDIDGDGRVLEMLVSDPGGIWCFAEDRRFLARAGPEDAPRYRRTLEGYDDDADGRFNEDGVGGIDLDRQFPVGWAGPGARGESGDRPLSSPIARRLADLVLDRDVDVALIFQGAHGGVALPRDARGRPLEVQRRLALAYARTSGRPEQTIVAPEDARTGRFLDWLHGVAGVTAIEVAVWGPDAVGHDGRPVLVAPNGVRPHDRSGHVLSSGPALDDAQRRWARWLDDVRGGAGFTEWHPVDLGGGQSGWIGGFEPRSRFNPPEESLELALAGSSDFVQQVVVGLPSLSVELARLERRGDLIEIDVRITNRGELPTGLGDTTSPGAGAVEVRLEAACDAALLAGAPVQVIEGLGGRETSRTLRWVVTAHAGGTFVVTATSEHAGAARREVRP